MTLESHQIQKVDDKILISDHPHSVSIFTTNSALGSSSFHGATPDIQRSHRLRAPDLGSDQHSIASTSPQQPSYLSVLSSHHSTPFPSAIQPAAAGDHDAQEGNLTSGWADPFHDDWPHW